MDSIISKYIGHYIFFVLALIALVYGIIKLREEVSVKVLSIILLSSVMITFFIIINFDRPSLANARQHYLNFQALEADDVEKIVLKKRLNGKDYLKGKIISETNVIENILFTFQNENKRISSDWGVQDVYSLCIYTNKNEKFFFKIISSYEKFDIVEIILEKNNRLTSIARYGNYNFRKLNLLD